MKCTQSDKVLLAQLLFNQKRKVGSAILLKQQRFLQSDLKQLDMALKGLDVFLKTLESPSIRFKPLRNLFTIVGFYSQWSS